jgi:hypothetical protein
LHIRGFQKNENEFRIDGNILNDSPTKAYRHIKLETESNVDFGSDNLFFIRKKDSAEYIVSTFNFDEEKINKPVDLEFRRLKND